MDDEHGQTPDLNHQPPTAAQEAEVVDLSATSGTAAVASTGVSRRRWVVAGIVTVAVLTVAVLVAALLAGRETPDALRYIAADSVVVLELRPELPGDQHAKAGELLSHFPGFQDQSTLDRKIDESLDLLVERASGGNVDYTTEVKPYLGGPAVLAVRGLEPDASGDPPLVLVMTTDGKADCHLPDEFQATTDTYRGVEIQIAHEGPSLACALDDRFAVIGSVDAVHAALDTKRDGGSIADDASYRAAQSALTGDHVAAGFINVRALVEAAMSRMPETPTSSMALPIDKLPTWAAMQVRAEDDALVLNGVAQLPADAPAPAGPDHASNLAGRLPGSTVFALEGHNIGASIKAGLDELKNDPAAADVAAQIEAATQMLGGLDALTGWMGDAAIAATLEGKELSGGLLLEATDEAKAAATLASIRNLLVLAGTGSDIHLTEVDHEGTTIYVLDLGDMGAVLDLPVPAGGTNGMQLSLAFAQRDDLVVLGISQAFVETVLDVGQGDSLADNPRYRHAIDLAGSTNNGQGFLDLAALLDHYRSELTGDAATSWDANIKPWISPFEGVAFSGGRNGDRILGRAVVTVR